jgi:sugar lactone lactonase YvrE
VHPDRIENGAGALAVLGQDNFTSTEVGLSATRWRLPGDLVVDETHQRLFVGVATQHRVVVFDIHPDRLRNGQAAMFVIGQQDFNTQETGLSDRMLREPDGLSYDAANDRLYVSDKRNQRVLVFDAHPDRLRNFPAAIGVLGEPDFDHMRVGPGDPRNHPDRLHDPRGSYFDAVDQRLYQSEGLNGRMTVFTLPRETYRVDLPARSSLRYASLDAQLSTGPQPLESGYSIAQLDEAGKVVALSTHLVTRAVMHDQSERQSRQLISVAMLAVSAPVSAGQFYVDSRSGRDTALSLVNRNDGAVRVRFELETVNGERLSETRRLGGDGQLSVRVSALFTGQRDLQGVLRVEADGPLSMSGLLEIPNGQGHTLRTPAPFVADEAALSGLAAERRVLPVLTTGAGQHVEYVLINPSDETLRGQLEVAGHAPVAYEIAAGGVFVHETPSDGQPLLTGHGIVRASEGIAPSAYAVVMSSRRDGSVRSVHTVTSHQEGTLFWAPVDTYPDVLHHGDIDAELSIVSEGLVHATLYLELFDIDGQSTAKYERSLPLGERAMLSLEEVFGRSPLRGTLRVFSDTAVTMSLQETTMTIDNEMVVADVPLQPTPAQATSELVYPVFHNGEGQATELMLINTDRRHYDGSLSVLSPQGEAQAMILR